MLRKGQKSYYLPFTCFNNFCFSDLWKDENICIGIFTDASEAKNHFEVFRYFRVYPLALCGAQQWESGVLQVSVGLPMQGTCLGRREQPEVLRHSARDTSQKHKLLRVNGQLIWNWLGNHLESTILPEPIFPILYRETSSAGQRIRKSGLLFLRWISITILDLEEVFRQVSQVIKALASLTLEEHETHSPWHIGSFSWIQFKKKWLSV